MVFLVSSFFFGCYGVAVARLGEKLFPVGFGATSKSAFENRAGKSLKPRLTNTMREAK